MAREIGGVLSSTSMLAATRAAAQDVPALSLAAPKGIVSYCAFHAVLPNTITTTERLGLAMIHAAKRGSGATILETGDTNLRVEPLRKGLREGPKGRLCYGSPIRPGGEGWIRYEQSIGSPRFSAPTPSATAA
jgi:hypothetical protein